jgi:hypothetical protein
MESGKKKAGRNSKSNKKALRRGLKRSKECEAGNHLPCNFNIADNKKPMP